MPSIPSRLLQVRPTTAASLFYFCFFAAQAAFGPFLSVYYSRTGLSGSEIGLLAAIGPLMSLLVAPSIGALADKSGRRLLLLVLSMVGAAFTFLLLALPTSFLWFVPIVALLYVVGSPTISIADGLIARMAARRGVAYGRMRLWGSLSWAIVAAGVGAIWQQIGYSLMFPLATLLLLTAIPFARRLEDDRSIESQAKPSMLVVIGDRRLRVVLLSTFVLGLAMTMTSTFSGIYLNKVGGGLLVGVFSGLVALTELPIMHWGEAIVRRLGGPLTLVLSYLLFSSSYLGMALIGSPVLLLGAALLQGLGFGLFLPITVRLVSDWSPPEWSSTSQGLMNAGLWGLAPLISGPLGGLIYDSSGPAAVFLSCVGATLLAGLIVVAAQAAGLFKRRADAVEPLPHVQVSEVGGVE